MTTACIVQARTGSTRLPGKVMLPLGGKPMLARLVERLLRCRRFDKLLIATTLHTNDDVIEDLCAELALECHRGSEHDVLARYVGAAEACGATHVVRVTSDCPLLDPALLDQVVDAYRRDGCDYMGNMQPPTWPHGMAVEVMKAGVLLEAHREARDPAEREHVTPFLYWRPQRYRLGNLASSENLSHHRWTVDTPQDYKLVRRLFEALHPVLPAFTLQDILALTRRHPEWSAINQDIRQKVAVSEQEGINDARRDPR